MGRDGAHTRQRLIEEGLRLFARDGIDRAQIREIVRAAGQSNDSAIHYHFGSRSGLLLAICRTQIAKMEPARQHRLAVQVGPVNLAGAVADIVEPTSDLLRDEDGRRFLRLMAQLAGQSGVRTGTIPAAVVDTALLDQLQQLQRCCEHLPPALARERVAFTIGALTASLADRAATLDAGERPLLAHRPYVANLVAMLIAGLQAPRPGATTGARSA